MRFRHAGPALLFAALAVAWTYPLVWHLTTHIPGKPGDNYSFLWNFWWMREALASPSLSFLHSTHLFAPYGVGLVNHPHTALQAAFGATILGGVPLIPTLNLVILLSVLLTALSTYALAYDITSDSRAATFAGVIVGGSPYMSAHMMGHFDLLAAWVLPLTALCVRRALITARGTWMAGCGVSLALAAYSAYYYVVYAALLAATLVAAHLLIEPVPLTRRPPSPATRATMAVCLALIILIAGLTAFVAITGGAVWAIAGARISMRSVQNPMTVGWVLVAVIVACRWRSPLRLRPVSSEERRLLVRMVAWTAAVFAICTAPLIADAVLVARQGRYVTQTYFWRSSIPGVDLAAFVLGNPFHPLWRGTIGELQWFDRIESVAWWGVVPTALLLWRRRGWPDVREARAWLAILIVALVWALGPRLLVAGLDVGLPLPQFLAWFVPIVNNARVPGRAMVLVYLALGMLAAMRLASRTAGELRPRIYWALLGLLLLDFLPAPIPLTPLDQPNVYRRLAAIDDGAPLCGLPFGFGDGMGGAGYQGREVLYYATIHRHPLVGGFIGRMPPAIASEYGRNPTLARFLELSGDSSQTQTPAEAVSESTPDGARALPCRYLVIDRRAASSELLNYARTLPLRLLESDEARDLFVIEDGAR